MNAKQGSRSYADFEPSFEWSSGEDSDILRVHLPGFKREHIKVQVDSYGNLRTIGERPLEDNRWSRFWKDFLIPANCNVNEIRAKFDNETLVITLPKEIAHAKSSVPNKLPSPSKPAPAPPKAAPVTELPKPAVPEPKPTVDQASIAAGPRNGPTNGKLGEMLSTKLKEEKVDDKVKGTTASPVGDKKETDMKEEEKVDDKVKGTTASPVGDKKETDTKEEEPVEEKRTEKMSFTEAAVASAGPAKEPAQASGVMTALQYQRRGLLLNVAVALIVLVGIGFYWSFKLRKGIADGDHNNTKEL